MWFGNRNFEDASSINAGTGKTETYTTKEITSSATLRVSGGQL